MTTMTIHYDHLTDILCTLKVEIEGRKTNIRLRDAYLVAKATRRLKLAWKSGHIPTIYVEGVKSPKL